MIESYVGNACRKAPPERIFRKSPRTKHMCVQKSSQEMARKNQKTVMRTALPTTDPKGGGGWGSNPWSIKCCATLHNPPKSAFALSLFIFFLKLRQFSFFFLKAQTV